MNHDAIIEKYKAWFMLPKLKENRVAIQLRKRGFSYREILEKIPVAKSTLSLWLRNVSLAKRKRQRLTEKRIFGAFRGAQVRKNQRLDITKEIKNKARNEIGKLSRRELWLIGIVLYWAEGAKQKENNPSERVKFSNSDPRMIKVFLKWIRGICKVSKEDIYFRISLHKTAEHKLNEAQKYWAKITGFPISDFQRIDWKKHKINTKRKNVGEKYFGLLNIYIRKSTNFNRKIAGWIEGIYKNCGVV